MNYRSKFKINSVYYMPAILICMGVLGYLGILIGLFNVALVNIVKFILMNVISVFLPGFAILILSKIRCSKVSAFFLSYILGYAFVVLVYFLAEIVDRKISFGVISYFFSMVSVTIMVINRKKIRELALDENDICDLWGAIFFLIFLFFSIFAYAAPNAGTDVIDVFKTHRDMQYWVNNSVALKLSWPADNLFFLGDRLNYHYFSNIPIAFLSEVYTIDVFSMSFQFYAFTKAAVMVGSVNFLLKNVNADGFVSFVGYIVILFTTGIEYLSVVTYVHHILLSPFGFDIGFAYGIFFVSLILVQWKKDNLDIRLLLCNILVWCMCIGSKAPVASVLLLLAGMICFFWLIHKKWGLAFTYGFLILGSFLLICKYCIGMFDVIQGDSAWQLGIYTSEKIKELYYPETWDFVGTKLTELGSNSVIWAIIIRCFSVNPIIIFTTVLGTVDTIIRYFLKKIDLKYLYLQGALLLSAIVGLMMGVFEDAGGNSEMYFSMAALIPMFNLSLNSCMKIKSGGIDVDRVKKYILSIFVYGFIAISIIVGAYRFAFSAWDMDGAVVNSIIGINMLTQSENYEECDKDIISEGIRKSDVDALDWIRNNADKDAIVVTDKAIVGELKSYYLYGIFCERQQYLEGSDMLGTCREDTNEIISCRISLINDIYNNIDGAIDRAKEEEIDYIVQTIDVTPNFIPNEKLELVAHSNTMNIFKVK